MARTPVTRRRSKTPTETPEQFIHKIVLNRIDDSTPSNGFQSPSETPKRPDNMTHRFRKSVSTEQRVVYQNRVIRARSATPGQSTVITQRSIARQELEEGIKEAVLCMKQKLDQQTKTFTQVSHLLSKPKLYFKKNYY